MNLFKRHNAKNQTESQPLPTFHKFDLPIPNGLDLLEAENGVYLFVAQYTYWLYQYQHRDWVERREYPDFAIEHLIPNIRQWLKESHDYLPAWAIDILPKVE